MPARDPSPPQASIAVFTPSSDPAAQARGISLASACRLPLVHSCDVAFATLLAVAEDRLELRFLQPGGPGPLCVDFVGGRLGYARRVNQSRLLFRAIGSAGVRPTVLDATAGLGRDAFWLAWRGCRVTAIERSPILFALP